MKQEIKSAAGPEGVLFMPQDARGKAAVIILHERYGLVQHTLDLAQKLADDGYVAFAPNLFAQWDGDQAALKAGRERVILPGPGMHARDRHGHRPAARRPTHAVGENLTDGRVPERPLSARGGQPAQRHRRLRGVLRHNRWAPDTGYAEAARLSMASGGVSNDQVLADTQGAIAYLRQQPWTSEKLGIIGYCLGGRQSFYVSTRLPFDATIMCYGPKIIAADADLNDVTPVSPITLTSGIVGPVLGLFGAEDKNPSPEIVAQIDAELTRLGKDHKFVIYQNAGHAFFAVDLPSYRVEAANEGWHEVLDFFETHLNPVSA